jgi:glycosyltransferase involved in cell wall biosynthesis
MPDICVLIPTANRPHLLANALASVACQTAVRRIAEVVVMENSGNRASEETCKKFPNLPIRYVFREPRIPIAGLVASWFGEARFPLVAMSHDDDWWAAPHLERSVAALEQNPDASAVYSSCHVVINETAWTYSIYGSFLAWFADDAAPAGGLRKLDFERALLSSLLGNAFHMSSMLALRSAIEASLPGLDDGNEYDYDRSLAVELSRHGRLLFSDTPSAFVRMHPEQYSGVADASGRDRLWFPRNTRRLLKLAADCGIPDVHARLADRFSRLGLDFYTIAKYCTDPSLDTLYEEKLLPPAMVRDYCQRKRNQKIRSLIRRILHPGRFFKS